MVAINKTIMAKVITFSRQFPKGHQNEGEPTYFVEKLILGFPEFEQTQPVFDTLHLEGLGNLDKLWAKKHTIRRGKRFKEGDMFSPRVWLGKPYTSKQFAIAPDIQIVKTYDFDIDEFGTISSSIIGAKGYYDIMKEVAKNDGLYLDDFEDWFKLKKPKPMKPFNGQIICWQDCGY